MPHLGLHVIADAGLGNSAYLLDLGDGRALAVDVSRDLRDVYAAAERRGLHIAFAADTHLHADFVTGAVDLYRREGARLLASAGGNRDYAHEGLRDGDEVDLGGLSLRALLTPGHTDEHVAFEILDGAKTVGVFTGGSLIVGAAARTDLVDPDRAEEFARAQYRSLRRLAELADDVAVWPTHGGGSFCSVPSGSRPTSTIGAERATNPLMAAPDEDTFVRTLLGSLGTHPPYFRRLGEINRRGPGALGSPVVPALSVQEVREAQAAGAEVVDTRSVRRFSAGHVPGSVSIPLRPVFASWLGWLVDFDTPVVIVRDRDQDLDEVWWQAHKIGFERIIGELDGGIEAWAREAMPTAVIPLVGPDQVGARPVLDIRQRNEFVTGHVPHAQHVELGALATPSTDSLNRVGLDDADPTVVMCGHGERAMGAASLLAKAGHRNVAVLDGGPDEWVNASGTRLATGAPTSEAAPGRGQVGKTR